jgi:hypothetical protein
MESVIKKTITNIKINIYSECFPPSIEYEKGENELEPGKV